MSRTSSNHKPFSRALPSSEIPSGPGNISGKSVRTVADQSLDMVVVFFVLGHRDDDISRFDIEHRHRFLGEGQMHAVAIGTGDLDHVAGAEIMNTRDLAQHPSF